MSHHGARESMAAFLALAVLAGCSDRATKPIVERAPWSCDGVVVQRYGSGRPLRGVQVWVSDIHQTSTDSTGAFHVVLGFERSAVERIRFTLQDYITAVADLDTAAVVGDRRLRVRISMFTQKDEH